MPNPIIEPPDSPAELVELIRKLGAHSPCDTAEQQQFNFLVGYACGLFTALTDRADVLCAFALKRVETLKDAQPGTPEVDELAAWSNAIERYEQLRWPI